MVIQALKKKYTYKFYLHKNKQAWQFSLTAIKKLHHMYKHELGTTSVVGKKLYIFHNKGYEVHDL